MRKLLIVVGILIIIALGFWFISNMTGNVITGAVIGAEKVVVSESFKISGFGEGTADVPSGEGNINEEDLNGTQNSSG